MLAVVIIYDLYYVEVGSCYAHFLENFYHKWMLNFAKCFFCIYWHDHIVFTLQFVNVVLYQNLPSLIKILPFFLKSWNSLVNFPISKEVIFNNHWYFSHSSYGEMDFYYPYCIIPEILCSTHFEGLVSILFINFTSSGNLMLTQMLSPYSKWLEPFLWS